MKNKQTKYTKKALIKSEKYGAYCDLLNVLLEEEKQYSFEEVDKEIKKFMTKGVK